MENKEEKINDLLDKVKTAINKKDLDLVCEIYREIVNICTERLKTNKNDIDALNNRAKALLQLSTDSKTCLHAIKDCNKILDIAADNTDALNTKALALIYLGSYEEAIKICEKVLIKIGKKNIQALSNKAFALFNLDRYQESIQVYDKVLAEAPQHTNALTFKAIALDKLGEREKQIKCYDELLKINENDIDALRDKASVLRILKRYPEEIECYNKILESMDEETDWLRLDILNRKALAQIDLQDYKKAIESCNEALDLNIDHNNKYYILNSKAMALSYLGEHKEAIKLYNEALAIAPTRFILINKYLSIKNLPNDEIALYIDGELLNQTKECNVTILEMAAFIYNQSNTKSIYENLKKLFCGLLDAGKDDIYKDAIKDIDPNKEDLSSYKSIYIDSLLLVALLRVDMRKSNGKKAKWDLKLAEDDVAHYTAKWVAERMLFKDQKDNNGTRSNFRLSSIVKANDPDEGNTLLSFLGIDSCFHQLDEYAAFIGCFTFNHSSLNQFRLYGKENNREATGVSLVLQKDFFAADMQQGVMADTSKLQFGQNAQVEQISKEKEEDKKYPLFRCVYVDPKTGKVISVGHREEYTFYRESKGEWTNKNIKRYKKETEALLKIIKFNFNKLTEEIKKLETEDDKQIAAKLVIHLRYLVKHMAFKEEQECRIIRIEKLLNNPNIHVEDDSRMYINYRPIYDVISHVYFAPQASDYKLFRNRIAKDYGDKPKCRQCDHPFSC